jgi:hypothetical protein
VAKAIQIYGLLDGKKFLAGGTKVGFMKSTKEAPKKKKLGA